MALAAARWTGGLVDPTVGAAVIRLGYDRDFAAIRAGSGATEPPSSVRTGGAVRTGEGHGPQPAPVPGWASAGDGHGPQPAPVPGWASVRLEGTRLTVPSGVCLDLGATAKGLGSDRAAGAAWRAAGGGGVLVSLGGDIAVAGESPGGGWPIMVADSSSASASTGAGTDGAS